MSLKSIVLVNPLFFLQHEPDNENTKFGQIIAIKVNVTFINIAKDSTNKTGKQNSIFK